LRAAGMLDHLEKDCGRAYHAIPRLLEASVGGVPRRSEGSPRLGEATDNCSRWHCTPSSANARNDSQDIVTRFAHSNGFYVERRFGWDTHGLPVEHEIDKKLGITCKEDVMALGIDKYNEECRAIVMRYSAEWRRTVERLGRWIDFDNDYKTLNTPYMESVWWVFGQLWKKDLVYKGLRVMPYTTGCTTPLSNFEAGLEYREVQDPAG